jgi:hypothetical protein
VVVAEMLGAEGYGVSARAVQKLTSDRRWELSAAAMTTVKYIKRNALAGRRFASCAELDAHQTQWKQHADERVHGTTHQTPERVSCASRLARDPP